jgi:hypothetical protein
VDNDLVYSILTDWRMTRQHLIKNIRNGEDLSVALYELELDLMDKLKASGIWSD